MCSFALVALLLLSDAWYAGRLTQFEGSPHRKTAGYLALGLMLFPLWIGVSRVTDYFHFGADVIFGWLLGVFFSGFAYVLHCEHSGFFLAVDGKKSDGMSRLSSERA
jgi:membrane-associated phospholipid phosphatase